MLTIDFPAARRSYHPSQNEGQMSAYSELLTRWWMTKGRTGKKIVFVVPTATTIELIDKFMQEHATLNNPVFSDVCWQGYKFINLDYTFTVREDFKLTTPVDNVHEFETLDDYNTYRINRLFNNKDIEKYNQIGVNMYDINIMLDVSAKILSTYRMSILWNLQPAMAKIAGEQCKIEVNNKIKIA